MTYKIISVSILIIIAFVSNYYCIESNDDTAGCDPDHPTIPYLNNTSGRLKVKDINERKGKESKCVWILDANNIPKQNIHLDVTQLSIGISDTLIVTDNNDKNAILYQLKGSESAGVILLSNKVKNITVTLSLTNETIDRQFMVDYCLNDTSAQLQNIESAGSYVFAYYNTSTDLSTDFDITLSTDLYGKNILINFEAFDLTNGGKVTFDDAVNVANNVTFDKTKPSFLLSKGNKININIKGFKNSKTSQNIRLNYELVDSVCSQYSKIEVKELDINYTINMLLPNDTVLSSLSSFKCFNLFDHQNPNAKLLLDLVNFKFTNIYDRITVLDGDSRDSQTLALIESRYLEDYWKQVYLYSSSNKLWILFESPFVVNKTGISTSPIGVIPKSQGGNIRLTKTNPTVPLNLKKFSNGAPVIYNFEVDEGFQAVIDFKSDVPLPGNENQTFITIYETQMKNGVPLIRLQSKSFPPDIMASNTNAMRIEFNPTETDFDANLYQFERGCHSSVSDISNSYSLSKCNTLCSWLIPNSTKSNGTFILQFSHLYLPEKTDIMRIEKLGPKISTILQLNGPFKSMTFPDLNLDPSYSYILYTNRTCTQNSTDGSSLLSVSFLYVAENLRTHSINLTDVLNETISTQNYPNYFSLGSDHLWQVVGKEGQKVLMTFTDLDLTPIDKLELQSNNKSQIFTNANVSSQTSDSVLSLPLFLNLSSNLIGSNGGFGARGFRANLTTVECGEEIVLEQNKTSVKNITTPSSLTGISKCIWIVTVPNPDNDRLSLIEFDITFGKDVHSNNGLKIYDSNSVRDNQVLNLTYFNKTSKSSSTNSIIIEYTISDPKKDLSLTLNFTTVVCNNTFCGNPRRCLLKEFFCNNINDCGDWSDEKYCNSSQPIPPPPPPPPIPQIVTKGGVNGWVVLFVICPLCIGLGIAATIFGPTLMSRFRRGRYREFQDFSEVS